MGFIRQLVTRTSQPEGPVEIDRDNPLTKDIKGAFSALTTNQLVNAVAGVMPTSDTGTTRLSPSGVMRDYVSGQKSSFANRADYGLAGPMTIVVIADVDALTNYGALLSCQDTATTNGWELRIGVGATDSSLDLVRANGGYRQFKASASNLITAGTKKNFISVRSNTAEINSSPTFAVNGIEYVAGASFDGTGTGNAIASTGTLDIGARASGVTQLDGAVLFAAIWNRALSFGEIEQLRANPWQIFQPIKRRIQVASAGDGVSGTIAATVAAFTSSIAASTTIVGSMAQTLAAVVSAITGSTTTTGTIAKTLENDVGNLQGSTGSTSGTIAVTAQNDTASMSGTTTIVGSINASTENATSNATGSTTILGQMAASVSNFVGALYGSSGAQSLVNRLLTLLGVGP